MKDIFNQLESMTQDELIALSDAIDKQLGVDISKRQDTLIKIAQRKHFGIGIIGLIKALRLIEEDMSLVEAKNEIERLFTFGEGGYPIKKEIN